MISRSSAAQTGGPALVGGLVGGAVDGAASDAWAASASTSAGPASPGVSGSACGFLFIAPGSSFCGLLPGRECVLESSWRDEQCEYVLSGEHLLDGGSGERRPGHRRVWKYHDRRVRRASGCDVVARGECQCALHGLARGLGITQSGAD